MLLKGNVTAATEQGPRSHQEDRFFFERVPTSDPSGWFMAVMDGHNGEKVSQLCAELFRDYLPKLTPPTNGVKKILRGIVSDLGELTDNCHEGSTLSIAWPLEDRDEVTVAVIGDSPVIVIDEEGNLRMSPEHNVRTNPHEREAVIARGGSCDGAYVGGPRATYGLQMSRALGNAPLRGIVTREPEIYTVARPRIILVATDGIFDPYHSDTDSLIIEISKEISNPEVTATDVIASAKRRTLQDNATAVLWRHG